MQKIIKGPEVQREEKNTSIPEFWEVFFRASGSERKGAKPVTVQIPHWRDVQHQLFTVKALFRALYPEIRFATSAFNTERKGTTSIPTQRSQTVHNQYTPTCKVGHR